MDWQATEFNNSWRYAFHALSRKNPAYNDKAEIQRSVEKWTRHMNILDRQLQKTGGHVVGDHFTLADIPMGLSVHRWFMTPIEGRADLPAVNAYYERLKARPAFNRYSGDIP
jgi:glutathione S-transferase